MSNRSPYSNRSALCTVAGAITFFAMIVACEDDNLYVYTARRFDEANGCFHSYSPIERVPGESVDVKCAPACLTVDGVLYVSPVCPPLPPNSEPLEESDPRCKAALEAFREDTSCDAESEGDGGEDSGDDAGAEEDAAEET